MTAFTDPCMAADKFFRVYPQSLPEPKDVIREQEQIDVAAAGEIAADSGIAMKSEGLSAWKRSVRWQVLMNGVFAHQSYNTTKAGMNAHTSLCNIGKNGNYCCATTSASPDFSAYPTSSMIAMGAASPSRVPVRMMRVYPPCRSAY